MKEFFCFLIIVITTVVLAQHKRQDWWQNGNFYQIYPRSFRDSNGDGIGDLNGITQKLKYLKDIGMDGVWLSPIFKSPMADFGYDISNYIEIQKEYGSIADLEKLIDQAHKLGLHIVLDFVPNHTSDEHEWFIKSVKREKEFENFYIWHNGKKDESTGERKPPSNWVSTFQGSAWEWNDERQQYYYHQFGVKQPDLNYRNPDVLSALDDVLRFWLSKGIDGFRIDAVPYFYEVDVDSTGNYPDELPKANPSSNCVEKDPCYWQQIYTKDLPENIDVIYHWRKILDGWPSLYQTNSKILMTEAFTSIENLMLTYTSEDQIHNGSHIPFNFIMFGALNNQSSAKDYKDQADLWLSKLPPNVFANWVMGNHDNNRIADRFGVERIDLMNIFLQTLPGIAVTYNGEEYGQEDVYISWEDTVDIQACNTDKQRFANFSRDPERAPFQWDSSKNAGFSKSKTTWLPVGPNYRQNNVAKQLAAPHSHLKIFKRLTALRKEERAFDDGKYVSKAVNNVLVYQRRANSGDPFLIVLNVGDQDQTTKLGESFDVSGFHGIIEVSSLQADLKIHSLIDLNSDFVAKAHSGYVIRMKEPELKNK